MPSSFTLKPFPQLIFGPKTLVKLEKIIPQYGKHPLVILGGTSFLQSKHYGILKEIFHTLEVKLVVRHIYNEPSPALINSIVGEKSDTGFDMVIAIGGGSVLDAGKAISAMLAEKGDVTRFLEGIGISPPSGKKLPFIALPTTSGTGSEATSNAVLSNVGQGGFKKSLRHDNYVPNVALIDPELTLVCSTELTAACAMDCFTQLVEGYLSSNSSSLTDTLALEGLSAIDRSLQQVVSNGGDIHARADISYAAFLSGIVLANAGLGTIHGFASVLGGYFSIPHGVVCGTLMASANRITLQTLRATGENKQALQKYCQLGKIFSSESNKSESWYQDCFINKLEYFSNKFQIPMLSDYGVTQDDIGGIARETANKNNPAQLDVDQLAEILRSRIN